MLVVDLVSIVKSLTPLHPVSRCRPWDLVVHKLSGRRSFDPEYQWDQYTDDTRCDFRVKRDGVGVWKLGSEPLNLSLYYSYRDLRPSSYHHSKPIFNISWLFLILILWDLLREKYLKWRNRGLYFLDSRPYSVIVKWNVMISKTSNYRKTRRTCRVTYALLQYTRRKHVI